MHGKGGKSWLLFQAMEPPRQVLTGKTLNHLFSVLACLHPSSVIITMSIDNKHVFLAALASASSHHPCPFLQGQYFSRQFR
jgi:hypothetical protein